MPYSKSAFLSLRPYIQRSLLGNQVSQIALWSHQSCTQWPDYIPGANHYTISQDSPEHFLSALKELCTISEQAGN